VLKIKIRSYPSKRNNMPSDIWAYLAGDDVFHPPFPDFELLFKAPEVLMFSFKGLWTCNWLQA